MHRLRKHIRWADSLEFIPVIAQIPQIPRQRRAVAADVNDPLRLHFDHGREEGFVAAFAGWVDDDDIGADAFFFVFFREDFFGFADVELGVGKAV